METSIIQRVEKPVHDIVAKATAMTVINQEQRIVAGDFLKNIKDMQKEVSDTFDPIVTKAHEAHKEAVAQRDKYLTPLKTAEKDLKSKCVTWEVAEEQKRLEEQARLIKEAEEQAEIQRKALEAEAEKLIDKGDVKAAETLIKASENVEVAPKIAYSSTLKVKGQALKSTWSAEVIDLKALVKAVAEGKAPITFLMANQTALNQQAKASMDSIAYPGVKFKETKTMSSTGRLL